MRQQKWMLIFALCLLGLLISLQCSKPTDDDVDADKKPPELIADLTITSVTAHSMTIQWTAPHDYRDDNSQGMVDEYDIRISYDSITAANFAEAYKMDSIPGPVAAGYPQQCDIEQLEPDSTYYFAIKSKDDKGNWSGVSNCCHATCLGVSHVVFADAALEQYIRDHIGKPTGDILSTDVDTILFVDAPSAGIASIVGLEFFTSLHGANLWGNEISDLTPFAATPHIWGLSLGANNITDLSPLSGHVELHQLHIAENPITNISTLATLPSLQQLFMHGTQVTDFSPLYGLEHLDDVHFASLNLTDISFVSNLTHLKICKLNSNQITSLAPLSSVTTLEGLDLSMNQINDVGPLASLVNLTSLSLVYNNIAEIQGLVDNTGLGTGDVVYLGGNPLTQPTIDTQVATLLDRGVIVYWDNY